MIIDKKITTLQELRNKLANERTERKGQKPPKVFYPSKRVRKNSGRKK